MTESVNPTPADPQKPASSAPQASPLPRRRRWLKRILLGLATLVVLSLLLVLLLPTLLSTSAGTSWALGFADGRIPGAIKVKSLSLAWFGGQKIEGLSLLDPKGEEVIKLAELDAPGLSLFSVLSGNTDWGTITLTGLDGTVRQDESGVTNLQQALGLGQAGEEKPKAAPSAQPTVAAGPAELPRLKFLLKDAHLRYEAPGQEPAEVAGLNIEADTLDPKIVLMSVRAELRQGDQAGRFSADLSAKDFYDEVGAIEPKSAKLAGKVELADVPVGAVDRITNSQGRLVALLGPVLQGNLTIDGQLQQIHAQWSADSQNLKATGSLALNDQGCQIETGSGLDLVVTPAGWSELTKCSQPPETPEAPEAPAIQPPAQPGGTTPPPPQAHEATKLLKPFTLSIKVQEGRVNRLATTAAEPSAMAMDLNTALFNIAVTLTDVELQPGDARLGTIALRQTRADLSFNGSEHRLKAQLSAQGQQNAQTGKLGLTAELTYPLTTDVQPKPDFSRVNVIADGKLESFPLALADQLANTQGLIVQAVGPTLDAQLQAQLQTQPGVGQESSPAVTGDFALGLAAAQLRDTQLKGHMDAGTLTVTPGKLVTLRIEPQLLAAAGKLSPGLANLSQQVGLAQAAEVTVTITKLVAPMDQAAQPLEAGLTVDITPLVGSGGSLLEGTTVGPLKLTVGPGKSSEPMPVSFESALQSAGSQPGVVKLASTVAGLCEGPIEVKGGGQLSLSIDAALLSRLQQKGLLNLPADWKSLSLAAPAKVEVALKNLTLALADRKSLTGGQAEVTLKVDAVQPVGVKPLADTSLRDVAAQVQWSSKGQTLADLAANVAYRTQNSALHARAAAIKMEQSQTQTLSAELTAEALPIALIEQWGGEPGKLEALLGSQIDRLLVRASPLANAPANPALALAVEMASPRANLRATGEYVADSYFQLTGEPASLTLQVTPESFAAWQSPPGSPGSPAPGTPGSPAVGSNANAKPGAQASGTASGSTSVGGFDLLEPLTLQAKISQARVGFAKSADGQSPAKADLASARVQADVSATRLAVVRKSDEQKITLQDLAMNVASESLGKLLTVQAKGKMLAADAATGKDQPRDIQSQTSITNLIDAQGAVNLAAAQMQTQTTVQDLPTDLVAALGGLDPSITQALGPTVSVTAKGQYPGDLDLTLQSANLQVPVSLSVNPQRVVTLRKDLVASLRLTPELSNAMLKYGSPVLIGARSEKPVTLTINKDTFKAPLAPFDLKAVALDAQLDLGQVTLEKSWVERDWMKILSLIAAPLKLAAGGTGQNSGLTQGTYTPLQVKLREGVVTTNDLWLSNETTALGFQGRANLVTRQLDATMGMLGESLLRQMPNLRALDIVNADTIYEFAVKGSMDDPRVEPGPFVASMVEALPRMLLKEVGGSGKNTGDLGALIGVAGQALSQVTKPKGGNLSWPNRPTLPPLANQPASQTPTPQQSQQAAPSNAQQQQKQQPAEAIGGILNQILQQAGEDKKKEQK
ncbi:MAG: hypothetical protein IT443_06485 [Phycisphaeraceae bacterium]|nr:hypothetical protein [Phycisphaeraceae bacterium]